MVSEEFPHDSDVNDPQDPERSWTRIFPGADDSVIVWEELWATKVYQTSYLSEAPHPGFGSEEGFHVAFTFVPAVFTQDVEDVNVMAAEHSSLAG